MNILIPALPKDTDSIFVKLALEFCGHNAVRWIGDEFSRSQTSSFHASGTNEPASYLHLPEGSVHLEDIDVVWLRRPRWPLLSDEIHPADRQAADQELRHYVRSLYESISDDAIWVNSLNSRRRGNSKLLQLKIARMVGLNIPDTLISNHPPDIRHFIGSRGECIVKPLLGPAFREGGKWKVCYTATVTEDMLPKDEIIMACPSIFQKKVEKRTEVRAVFFGSTVLAMEINSQQSLKGMTDWRAASSSRLQYRQIEMPLHIKSQCIGMMKKLGILHGSFDFAITPNGEWIFFEVNEAGQFLWMEYLCDELPVLETMRQFLCNPGEDFVAEVTTKRVRVRDIEKSNEFSAIYEEDSKMYHSEEHSALI